MPDSSAPPRNAQQLTAIQSHYESQLSTIVSQMNLRKWLVEKFGGTLKIDELDALHTFITAPTLSGLTPPKESQ